MNLTASISLLLAALTGTGALLLTADDLWSTYDSAAHAAARVQAQNDAQLVEAATFLYQIDYPAAPRPTLQQLVDGGYLKPAFIDRERVAVPAPH